MSHQEFDGKKFYRSSNGYYSHWETGKLLHRVVWEHHHGPIPEGMQIHHKDGDRANNNIENLEVRSISDHTREHWKKVKAEGKKDNTCQHCGSIFQTFSPCAKYCSTRCTSAAYRAEHLDEIRERERVREAKREDRREYKKNYYEANKQAILEKQRKAYGEKHPSD